MNSFGVILIMIATWLLVAVAALWGMLRIAHRHQRDAMERAQENVRERTTAKHSQGKRTPRKAAHA